MFDIESILKFNDYEYRDRFHDELIAQGFHHLGAGRHRSTYLSPSERVVIKIPRNEEGLYVNHREAQAYRRCFNQPDGNGQCYAPCRLIQNTILMMRTVVEMFGHTNGCDSARETGAISGINTYETDKDLPAWCDGIDACQVGYLSNGRLVAYDYGSSC